VALRVMRRLGVGGVQAKMALTYALGVAIVVINVVLSSMLMFFSSHDAGLLIVLLLFSALVALGFGQLMARTMTRGLEELADASEAIAAGDLERRVEVRSGDEIESVGEAFNAMVERMEQAQQREVAALQAQRSLIASASHDLRTPLTSLRATIEALTEGVVDDPPEVERYLEVAQADIRHLGALVEDLFELTRLNAGVLVPRLQAASLSDLVSDTLQSLHLLADERGVALEGRVDPRLDPVVFDPYLLQRALTNITENAIRHTPAGGWVRIAAEREGSGVRIVVSDTGEGILPADQPRIFDAFYRGEAARSRTAGEGAGLGLSITRAIVEAHRGRVSVDSRQGVGSVFEIRLPALDVSQAGGLEGEETPVGRL
ncbi:MAG TPA: HAMP domain-containing sensor histidine kinase, partial [Anaerolineales bacterium]|nr:HAMP domain-containing sensor histidine kinase [Anaerolineales bacterium]